MPLLAADPVIVEPAQRDALEALVRAHSTSQQLALRARMILHAADSIGVQRTISPLSPSHRPRVQPCRIGNGFATIS
jgi:hypothetical protein